MQKLIIIVAILLFPIQALCAPFLVCDPQTGVTTYKLTGMPAPLPATVTAQTNGSLRQDMTTSPSGSFNITVAACKADILWGEVCSATVPFSFTKPSAPTTPATVKLVSQ